MRLITGHKLCALIH